MMFAEPSCTVCAIVHTSFAGWSQIDSSQLLPPGCGLPQNHRYWAPRRSFQQLFCANTSCISCNSLFTCTRKLHNACTQLIIQSHGCTRQISSFFTTQCYHGSRYLVMHMCLCSQIKGPRHLSWTTPAQLHYISLIVQAVQHATYAHLIGNLFISG